MKKPNVNSIITRLFLSFLLVLLPIMAVGVFLFVWEKDTIKSQIENAAMDNVSFLQSTLETEVQNIKSLQYNLAGDTVLSKFVTQYFQLSNSDFYLSLLDIRQRLAVIRYSSEYIEDFILYIPRTNYMISVETGFMDYDQTEFNRLLDLHMESKYPLAIDESGINTTSVFPVVFTESETPLYLTRIVLSEAKVKNFLNKFNKFSACDTAIYDYTSKRWLFGARSEVSDSLEAKLGFIENAQGTSIRSAAKIEGKDYYVISAYSKYLNVSFVQYVPFGDIFHIPNQYGTYLWYYAALSLLIILAYFWFIDKFVKRPVYTLLKSFQRVESGDLKTHIRQKAASEFNDLFEGFNKMVFHLSELIDRVYRQELYAKNSELKQLQSQINPHFLYNTYFLLYLMFKEKDMENAEALSLYLGEYFQYITRNASQIVALHKEVEHACNYARIQQMRFPERLSFEFGEIPEKYRNLMVPRLLMQPIIENAIEHGLKTVAKKGRVRVWFQEIGEGFVISIEDSGDKLQDEDIEALQNRLSQIGDTQEVTGMINVHRRILLGFEQGSGIAVSRSALGGLRVEIRIMSGSGANP